MLTGCSSADKQRQLAWAQLLTLLEQQVAGMWRCSYPARGSFERTLLLLRALLHAAQSAGECFSTAGLLWCLSCFVAWSAQCPSAAAAIFAAFCCKACS